MEGLTGTPDMTELCKHNGTKYKDVIPFTRAGHENSYRTERLSLEPFADYWSFLHLVVLWIQPHDSYPQTQNEASFTEIIGSSKNGPVELEEAFPQRFRRLKVEC